MADVTQALADALRRAVPMQLPAEIVRECIRSGRDSGASSAEKQFGIAFDDSLAAIPRGERSGGVNGVTGHIAESVVESILVEHGWVPLEHFVGPFSGGHGVDLAMATADLDVVFAIEVKGTLASKRCPDCAEATFRNWAQRG